MYIYIYVCVCIYIYTHTHIYAMPCSLWDLSSVTRDWTLAMAAKAQNPNHWTIRELPTYRYVLYILTALLISNSILFIAVRVPFQDKPCSCNSMPGTLRWPPRPHRQHHMESPPSSARCPTSLSSYKFLLTPPPSHFPVTSISTKLLTVPWTHKIVVHPSLPVILFLPFAPNLENTLFGGGQESR